MSLRGKVLIAAVVIGLAVWALVGWGISCAAGAPVDGLAARSDAWLERTLGVPIPDRPVRVGSDYEMATCAGSRAPDDPRGGCSGLAYVDEIALEATTYALADEMAGGGWGWDEDTATLLHEQLHLGRAPTLLDEGLTEALRWDLWPAWGRAMRLRMYGPVKPNYPRQVLMVRLASARAVGGSWHSRAARLVRRAWWAAPDDVRAREVGARLSAAEWSEAFG